MLVPHSYSSILIINKGVGKESFSLSITIVLSPKGGISSKNKTIICMSAQQ